MDEVRFEEAPVIPQSDKHSKPKTTDGLTGWLVKQGLSKKQVNMTLFVVALLIIVLSIFILARANSENPDGTPPELEPDVITGE